jgi:hypothetical protein
VRHRFTLFCHLQPGFPACLCFTVERLSNRRRAADFAETQDFHLEVASLVLHLQQVAEPDITRGLGLLAVRLNLPRSQALAARERVLKNRAAQSHLSILTWVMIPFLYEVFSYTEFRPEH